MTRLLLATLGADRWGPLGAIEQRDPIEEGHLAHVLDLYSRLLLYFYLHLDRFVVGAPSFLVLPVPTKGTLPRLLGPALLHLVPPLSTAEAPDLAWVTIHEDWHFCWSLVTWDEGCRLRGRVYGGREGPPQLILDQTVEVGVLDTVLGGDQILLDDEILLGDLVQTVLRISAQLVKGVLQLHLSSEAIDFPNYVWVSHVCYCLVDEEFLWSPTLELPPSSCGHGGVEPGLSTDVDRDAVLGVTPPCSSSDIRIVGVILYVFGDDGAGFFVPFPIMGVWDVDGIEVATIKLIENEALRCRVGVLCHTLVVDAANLVFLDRSRAYSQLREEWLVWDGVIDGGICYNKTCLTDFIYFTRCTDTGVIATHTLSFYRPLAPLFLMTHAQLAVVTQSCTLPYTAAHCDLLLQ